MIKKEIKCPNCGGDSFAVRITLPTLISNTSNLSIQSTQQKYDALDLESAILEEVYVGDIDAGDMDIESIQCVTCKKTFDTCEQLKFVEVK